MVYLAVFCATAETEKQHTFVSLSASSSLLFLHGYVTASPTTTLFFGPTKSDEEALPAKSSIKFTHAFPVKDFQNFLFLESREDL